MKKYKKIGDFKIILKIKKIILGIGSASIVAIPMATVVACGLTQEQITERQALIRITLATNPQLSSLEKQGNFANTLPSQVTSANLATFVKTPGVFTLPENKGTLTFSLKLLEKANLDAMLLTNPNFKAADDSTGILVVSLLVTYDGVTVPVPTIVSGFKMAQV
ncbi:lipoprotein 17-related variable surface protein [[Mycoplasma] mobile]|uniref:Expressed putative lipoprotein n=1 Tax=Mycoplasma mobile (strain ATCC 43663 / 163K / NCTC 11711) TaxID=267748 RepID=Q6KHD6_MYCM1|nr:lipoprotein 17-related variable surface protein [[Mycoplasma] mobile]AAT27994.1 expressed putative lipoprotein [Mycoplasma mobile 163K]